jgi:hypothetical protein
MLSRDPFLRTTAARKAEIARRYQWKDDDRKRQFSIILVRIAELTRIYRSRYGLTLPDTGAGHDAMRLMAHHLAHCSHPQRRICNWLELWAPWMPEAEIMATAAKISARRRRFTARVLGRLLRLTPEERERLAITSIRAMGMSKADMNKRRRERDRLYRQQRRRANGAKPREQYEAQSFSRTKPWEIDGISERTWRRRRSVAEVRRQHKA